MAATLPISVPLIVNLAQTTVEQTVFLCISILVAVTVSAESQAFVATLLGDSRPGSRDRHHFNAFLHLDLLGSLCFFIAGFGWAKEVKVDRSRFRHPRFFLILSRLAGPLGNFMMANIAASISWILGGFGLEDRVFSALVVVNMMTAVYGLVMIPPLPGVALFAVILPNRMLDWMSRPVIRYGGGLMIIAFFALLRWQQVDLTNFALNPFVSQSCIFLRSL